MMLHVQLFLFLLLELLASGLLEVALSRRLVPLLRHQWLLLADRRLPRQRLILLLWRKSSLPDRLVLLRDEWLLCNWLLLPSK
jgi:hypothetical protein